MGFLLKDKAPRTIQEAHEVTTRIKNNLSSSKVEFFSAPRVETDTKDKMIHNVEATSDVGITLVKHQGTIESIVKNQELMMNRIVNLERTQQ